MPRYIVTTPLYDEPVDMIAPGEYVYEPTRDVTVVDARNRSAAKAAAVRRFKGESAGYFGTASANPFVGLTARLYDGPDEEEDRNAGRN